MIYKRLDPLEHFTQEQFQDWLLQGTKKMCGRMGGVSDAFFPVAEFIGVSREIPWTKELAWVYGMLSVEACRAFDKALDNALTQVVSSLSNDDWDVAIVLVDLMRETSTRFRMKGLKALTARLGATDEAALTEEAKKKLALSALMATFDVSNSERASAQEVATMLAKQIYHLYPARRQSVADRLQVGFAKLQIALPDEYQKVVPQDNVLSKLTKWVECLSGGPRHAAAC